MHSSTEGQNKKKKFFCTYKELFFKSNYAEITNQFSDQNVTGQMKIMDS